MRHPRGPHRLAGGGTGGLQGASGDAHEGVREREVAAPALSRFDGARGCAAICRRAVVDVVEGGHMLCIHLLGLEGPHARGVCHEHAALEQHQRHQQVLVGLHRGDQRQLVDPQRWHEVRFDGSPALVVEVGHVGVVLHQLAIVDPHRLGRTCLERERLGDDLLPRLEAHGHRSRVVFRLVADLQVLPPSREAVVAPRAGAQSDDAWHQVSWRDQVGGRTHVHLLARRGGHQPTAAVEDQQQQQTPSVAHVTLLGFAAGTMPEVVST